MDTPGNGGPETAASLGLALLSTVSRVLDPVVDDYESAVEAVATACVGHFADLCAIEVIGADREGHTEAARVVAGSGMQLPERWADLVRDAAAPEQALFAQGDAGESPQVGAVRERLGAGSLLVAPIRAGGATLGWFVAATGSKRPGLVESDRQVGSELCSRLGATIQRVRVYRRLQVSAREQGQMAHDFNNLLTLILGYSELLRRGITDPQLRLLAGEIEGAARRAADLTQAMLDSSGRAGPDAEMWPADRTMAGRILFVEDDPALRHAGQESLATVGLDVVAADSAEIAISLLNGDASYDALVTDIVLPGLSGVQLARAVRPTHPDLKVLYVTGYSGAPDADHTPAPGEPVLRKPYRPDSLRLRVAELLERS